MTKTPPASSSPPMSSSTIHNNASTKSREISRKRVRSSLNDDHAAGNAVRNSHHNHSPSKEKMGSKKKKKNNHGHHDEEPNQDESSASLLTPHTHRLLRLIKEGTSDHARMAALQLESIACQLSSSLPQDESSSSSSSSTRSSQKLWDLVGHLQSYLVHLEWKCRYNASLALHGVAQYIPLQDQIEFLKSTNHKRYSSIQEEKEQKEGTNGDHNRNLQANQKKDCLRQQRNSCSSLLWLHIQNVWDDFDTIATNGRILYSSSGSQYNYTYKQEQEQLQTLDDGSNNIKTATTNFVHERVTYQRQILAQRLGFINHPLLLNNHHTILSAILNQEDVIEESSQSREKNKGTNATTAKTPQQESIQERRQKHVQRIIQSSSKIDSTKKKQKGNDEENDNVYSIRTLLVMGMQQQEKQKQRASSSHCDAQTLLATEFIYRMFDPNWYIRHGSLLGALALLKAWRKNTQQQRRRVQQKHHPKNHTTNNNMNDDELYCFGIWPHDILARSLCVIILDRFGDYSTTGTISTTQGKSERGSSCKNHTPTIEVHQHSTVVIAPVRETAAQLVAILMTMASPTTQQLCFQIISQQMIPYHGNDNDDCWEVRHGAMLILKYFAATITSPSTTTSDATNVSHDNSTSISTVATTTTKPSALLRFTTSIVDIAIQGLVDDSDDVKGVAAQVLSCFLVAQSNSSKLNSSFFINKDMPRVKEESCIDEHEGTQQASSSLCYLTQPQLETMSQSLWLALESIQSVSSCVVDLVELFSQILCHDSQPLLHAVRHQEQVRRLADDKGKMKDEKQSPTTATRRCAVGDTDAAQSLNILLQKLVDFLDYDLPAVKLSSLQAIGVIMKPISLAAQKTQHISATYCNLLVRVFNAHFDIPTTSLDSSSVYPPTDKEESRRSEQLTIAIHSTWKKLVKFAPSFLRHVPDERNDLLLTLTFRYVGLNFFPSSAYNKEQVPPYFRMDDLLSEQTFESSKNRMFIIRHGSANNLALLLSELIHDAPSTTFCAFTSLDDDRDISSLDVCDFLGTVISSLLQSPWLPLVEAACFLYMEVCTATTVSNKTNGTMTVFSKSMERCHSILTDLLQHGLQYTVELKAGNYTDSGNDAISIKELIDICDRLFVASLQSQFLTNISQKTREDTDDSNCVSTQLAMLWRRTCETKAGNMMKKTDSSVNLDSVRVKALIVSAFLSRGSRFLPTKLTPLIRPLMTSTKNENFSPRQDVACSSIVQLVQYLSDLSRCRGTDAEATRKTYSRVRDKVLSNVCDMLVSQGTNLSSEPSFTVEQTAAQKIIRDLVSELPDGKTIEHIGPVWSNLEFLTISDPSTATELELAKSLTMLETVAKALYKDSEAALHLVQTVAPAIVLIACASPSPISRQASLSILQIFCYVEPRATLERAIPFVLQHLKDIENDAYRYGGCKVLHSLIEASRMDICPFVHLLLPIAMSLMTDPMEECSRIASRSFAALVRVAPLVQRSHSCSIPGIDIRDHRAERVIDHLIHGKPFPPYALPEVVENELRVAGVSLRNYQLDGIAWIHFLQTVNLNGALCDDMGLGKTLQALVGMSISNRNESLGTDVSLVVCPSTVVGHWISEINKYFPSQKVFRAFSLVGNAKKRDSLWKQHLSKSNIVVISYSVLRSEINRLVEVPWHYCVLDEGHLLKNHKTATAIAARRIRSRHRLILTGTPVQNRVNELWATFDFLMPSFLGSSISFQKEFAKPICMGHQSDTSAESINLAMEKLKLLHQQVLPFILRREKGQVLKELPPKCITDIPCTLSQEQEKLYKDFCEGTQGKKCLAQLHNVIEDATHSNNTTDQKDTSTSLGNDALKSLLFLRLLCTHPCLVSRHTPGTSAEEDSDPDFANVKFGRYGCSGKLQVLHELLQSAGICADSLTAADNDTSLIYCDGEASNMEDDNIDDSWDTSNGDGISDNNWEFDNPDSTTSSPKKCLIFAQFIQSLDVVEQLLFQPHMPSLQYVRLDGRVPQEERNKIAEVFNDDDSIRVMLLTTRIGGLGLNLTGADTVIFLEHDWNPHNDLQAMDRAHRLGQKRTVNVYRLVTQNTIEEKIMKLQKVKMSIANAIVNTDNSSMYSMGTDRLLDIFTFQTTSSGDQVKQDKAASDTTGMTNLSYLDEMYTQEDYSNLSIHEFVTGFETKPPKS